LPRNNPAPLVSGRSCFIGGSGENFTSSRQGETLGNPAVPNLRDGKTPVFPTPFPFNSRYKTTLPRLWAGEVVLLVEVARVELAFRAIFVHSLRVCFRFVPWLLLELAQNQLASNGF